MLTKSNILKSAFIAASISTALVAAYAFQPAKVADDLPFGDEIKEVKGIQVFMIDVSDQGGCFVFENETIESFYEKLVAA